jgi:glycolate oxidase FAD binding subunit
VNAAERVAERLRGDLPAAALESFDGCPGIRACPLVAPASVEEAAETLRLARAEGWRVLPLGRGSRLGWDSPPARVDLALSARRLAGIVAYEPDDGTLTARSGTSWAELVTTAQGRHHLSPELPGAERSTLGGVIGAGASGLDRLRHGPLRHQVLGIHALQSDGTRVKSGGRVVKNVTGYDLHRLWCGSRGSLCFLLEATLRLHPAPPACATLEQRFPAAAAALEASHALWRSGAQPLAVVLEGGAPGAGCLLTAVLAGREEGLAAALKEARRVLSGAAVATGADGWRQRAALRERELAGGGWAPLVLSSRPSRLAGALQRLDDALRRRGWTVRLRLHPLLATLEASFPDRTLGAGEAEALDRELVEAGIARRWRGLAGATPARGAEVARALERRLKAALDPEGVFVEGPCP